MDEELKAALCATYQGMSAEEIEAEISASRHAAKVEDPAALAAYIVEMCASYS